MSAGTRRVRRVPGPVATAGLALVAAAAAPWMVRPHGATPLSATRAAGFVTPAIAISPPTASAVWDVNTAGFAYTPPAPTGGTAPYTWSSTALPAGLGLDPATGAITGTPTATGTSNVTLTVTDSTTATTTQGVTVTIDAKPVFGSAVIVEYDVGFSYPTTMTGPTGGTAPFTWSTTAMPAGLSLDPSTGAITGTPTATGTTNATVTATDAAGNAASQPAVFVVAADPSLPATASVTWEDSIASSYTPVLTGGSGPFTWTAAVLAAPMGFIPSTGKILGSCNATCAGTIVLTVTDVVGRTASESLTVNMAASPSVTPAVTATTWMAGVAGFSYTPPAPAGGIGPFTWSSGALPTGLALDAATGALTGTPTVTGTTIVTLSATDSVGGTTTQTVAVTINPYQPPSGVPAPPPGASGGSGSSSGSGGSGGTGGTSGGGSVTLSATLAPASTGVGYQSSLSWGGGTGPLTWAVSAGTLPPGLALDPATGDLSGVPTGAGSYTFTVTATDSTQRSASEQLTVVVKAATGGAAGSHTIATTSDGKGYWFVTAAGQVSPFGDALFYGQLWSPTAAPAAPVVGIEPTPDDRGYWLVGLDGGVFAFGDAGFYGSMGGRRLNGPVVGMAATADGRGYWLVGSDGGVFAFGDAASYGSMGGRPLNAPVTGMASTTDGRGYWLVGSDGGVFAFGDAASYGSMGGHPLGQPVAAMAPTPDGRGYWLVGLDGGVFAFGDAAFAGSLVGHPLNGAVVGMAPTADGRGYWLVGLDGGVFAFGDAAFYGSDAPRS